MGCDTKGIVQGDFNGQVFDTVDLILNGINAYFRQNKMGYRDGSARFDATVRVATNGYIVVNFKDGNENRMLSVHFNCHEDDESIFVGKKLILGLGMWGNASTIIKAILDQFDRESWFIENNCSDYEKMDCRHRKSNNKAIPVG